MGNRIKEKSKPSAEGDQGIPGPLPESRVELEILCALLDDAEANTRLWLQVRPSAEERVCVYGMQSQLAEMHGIVTRRLENRVMANDNRKWIQDRKELLSLLRKAREARGCIVGKSLGRLEDRLATPTSDRRRANSNLTEERTANRPENKLPDRRAKVDSYIEEVFRQRGIRITRKDIWTKAGYSSRTEFERWERQDLKRPNEAADRNFSQLLRDKPHLK